MQLYYMKINKLNQRDIYEKYLLEISDARRRKIARCRNQKSKIQSLGAGILLAHGLRQYSIREQDAVIRQGENGKPYLADYPDIHFNLSHSGDFVAAAFGTNEIGIDIEHYRENGMKIANRFFTRAELTHLENCKEKRDRDDLFLRYWTLKESFLKVTGRGMNLPLNEFELQLEDDVTVCWNVDDGEYHFKEIALSSEGDIVTEMTKKTRIAYRIAICVRQDAGVPEIIRMEVGDEI